MKAIDPAQLSDLASKAQAAESARMEAQKTHDSARKAMDDVAALKTAAIAAIGVKFEQPIRDAHAAHEKALKDLREKTDAAESAGDALAAITKSN